VVKKCVKCDKELNGTEYWLSDGKHCKKCGELDISNKAKIIILIISLIMVLSYLEEGTPNLDMPYWVRLPQMIGELLLSTLFMYWIIKFIYKLLFFRKKI
jgi:uncharacterized membrane protein YhdT